MSRGTADRPVPDVAEIKRGLELFSNSVVEIRGLHCKPRDYTVSGYFDRDHLNDAAAAAVKLDASGVYVTMNPVDEPLLARAANRLIKRPASTTADPDIVRRRWLLCDFDPKRAAGISSTDAEKEAARERAERLREHLAEQGWPAPVFADSGNGFHLLYPVDLPNDDASRILLQRVLKALALRFSDNDVDLDLGVFNASRIVKLYGTVARKGDSTVDRPHRLAAILEDPELRPGEIVTVEQLTAIASRLPEEPRATNSRHSTGKSEFDLVGWLAEHSLPVRGPSPYNGGGEKWVFDHGANCPFGGAHDGEGSFIIRFVSGALAAGCHHNSCTGKTWADLRAIHEPDRHTGGHQRSSTSARTGPPPGESESPGRRIELAADEPLKIAEAFVAHNATHEGVRTIHRWEQEYWRWNGSFYEKHNGEVAEAAIAQFIYNEVALLKISTRLPERVPPKASHVEETLRALQNITQLATTPPAWMGVAPADLTSAITVKNGILLLGSRKLLPPSPAWFTLSALDVTYDSEATCPEWNKFLLQLWPNDEQSRNTLQEICGYLLTNDMSQEKIFAIIGPTRSGKGTIANTFVALLGSRNTARLTLSALVKGFERQILIGKTLATIPDARLGAKTDTAELLDVILTISGSDNPNIPRKYKDAYEGPLYVRFFLLSNVVPRFPDPAAAKRFIILKTTISFLGREDTTLKTTLLKELPGILNWGLTGWDRLQERGHFVQPESALDEVDALASGGNPVPRFVDDAAAIDVGYTDDGDASKPRAWAAKDDVYSAYQQWCEAQKEKHPLGYDHFFGKLKEAYPTLRDYRPRKGGQRPRYIMGITLLTEQEKSEKWRVNEEGKPK